MKKIKINYSNGTHSIETYDEQRVTAQDVYAVTACMYKWYNCYGDQSYAVGYEEVETDD